MVTADRGRGCVDTHTAGTQVLGTLSLEVHRPQPRVPPAAPGGTGSSLPGTAVTVQLCSGQRREEWGPE